MATQPVASNRRKHWLRSYAAILVSVVAGVAASVGSARTQEQDQIFLGSEAQDQRLQCGGRLERRVKEADYFAAGAFAPADPLCRVSPEVASLPPIATCTAQQLACEACLEKFVQHMDGILASRARSVQSLNILVSRAFPLKACNVDEALKVVAKSRYFVAAEQSRDEYSIWFSNGKDHAHTTYIVGFVLLKESGDSRLPYAQFLK